MPAAPTGGAPAPAPDPAPDSPGTRRRARRHVALGLAVAIAFGAGLAIGHARLVVTSPTRLLVWRVRRALGSTADEVPRRGVPPLGAAALRRVATPEGATERRRLLVRLLWDADSLPAGRHPDAVADVSPGDAAPGVPGIASASMLVTRMPHGIDSRAAWLRSAATPPAASCLMVYHQGHDGDWTAGGDAVARVLRAGCDVLALAMPLLGRNATPTIHDSTFGTVRLTQHDHLVLVDAPAYPLVRYFVEPVLASLNHVLAARRYDRVGMMGLSGGGWTTVLYAALDERVARSYPVAGSEPLFLRTLRPTMGTDAEQLYMPLLRVASYAEQYVLATTGGRRQLAVLNRLDACCFSGTAYRLYEPAVAAAAASRGGRFRVLLDETHAAHRISPMALDTILADFVDRADRVP